MCDGQVLIQWVTSLGATWRETTVCGRTMIMVASTTGSMMCCGIRRQAPRPGRAAPLPDAIGPPTRYRMAKPDDTERVASELVAQGLNNKQVAAQMYISAHTVCTR